MAKKRISKTTTKKKKLTAAEREELILQNFVQLQAIQTDLTVKFEKLSDNMANLLHLFEMAARSFIKKYGGTDTTEDEEMLKKFDTLIDQNKTIARGLTLLEEKVRHKMSEEKSHERKIHGLLDHEEPKSRPLPRL